MAPRFPLYIDLNHVLCVVVGGGVVATRRAESLLRCGAKVRVIAPAFSEALVAWCAAETVFCGSLDLVERPFREADVDAARLVVAATDSAQVNSLVASLCAKKQIPVSIADAPEKSTFYFPALVTRGDLCVGVNSAGASPAATKQIREIIEMVLPENLGERIAELGAERNGASEDPQ